MNVGSELPSGPHSAPIPHPERAMAAALMSLCPSHAQLVKAMCTKLGKEIRVCPCVSEECVSVHEHLDYCPHLSHRMSVVSHCFSLHDVSVGCKNEMRPAGSTEPHTLHSSHCVSPTLFIPASTLAHEFMGRYVKKKKKKLKCAHSEISEGLSNMAAKEGRGGVSGRRSTAMMRHGGGLHIYIL